MKTKFTLCFRNILFSPSGVQSRKGSTFPGLKNLMSNIEEIDDPTSQWEEVKKHLSIIIYIIHAAADTLTSSLFNSYEI